MEARGEKRDMYEELVRQEEIEHEHRLRQLESDRIQTYIHTFIHIHMYTYMHTYILHRIAEFATILTYIHTYTYIHTHIHTYMHAYIGLLSQPEFSVSKWRRLKLKRKKSLA